MKIAHVIVGLEDGGAEAALYRLCLSSPDVEHHVISMMGMGKYGALLLEHGVSVHALDMKRGRLKLLALLRLARLLREIQPDAVQTWMYHADLIGGIAGRLAGARNIVWGIHHSTLVKGGAKRSTMMIARVNALLSRWVPANIVGCSRASIEIHGKMGYSSKKLFVVPNGYDLTRFSIDSNLRAILRRELLPSSEIPLFGMVARFDPQKDHENFIRALGMLKRAGHLFGVLFVGAGMVAANEQLQHMLKAADIADRCILLGQRNDVPSIMNALDIHVLSSYTEAFPNVLAEAMACGTPCCATDVGDAAYIVGDTGWVAPPRDNHALASQLEQALQALREPELWRERQAAARRRIVENFDIETMVAGYRRVWNMQ